MLREMDEIRFACTACGKCCTEPPEMTVLEATKLGDVFVPALVYRLTSLPRDDNEAAFASLTPHPHFKEMPGRELVARLRESTAVRSAGAVVSEAGWDHHVSITARAWGYSAGCPALKGKECSIHTRRPSTCRTVPIRYDVPAGLLVRAFRGVVDSGLASKDPWECDVSGSAPVLLRDGALVDTEYSKAREVGEAAALAEKSLCERILAYPLLPPLREVYPLLRQRKLVSVSFHGALAAAHDLALLDDAAMKTFLSAQLDLIDREITAALARKRREDRDTTTRFRTLRDAYASMRKTLERSGKV
jgi:Fe-S-cluster containining protein